MNDPQNKDDDKTFDMYHFFSRWDVLLFGGFILLLLLVVLYLLFAGAPVQAAILLT